MKKLMQYAILYTLFVTTITKACPFDQPAIIEITTQDHHQNFLQNNQGPSAVLYHMDNCHYCKQTKPQFEQLAQSNQFNHVTFYTAHGPNLQAEQDVQKHTDQEIEGYPTMLFFNQGRVVDSQIGATEQDVIIQKLQNLTSSPGKSKKIKGKANNNVQNK